MADHMGRLNARAGPRSEPSRPLSSRCFTPTSGQKPCRVAVQASGPIGFLKAGGCLPQSVYLPDMWGYTGHTEAKRPLIVQHCLHDMPKRNN